MKWLVSLCCLWCLPLLMPADACASDRASGVVRCESKDMTRTHCAMDTEHGVQLVRQLSETSCIRGSDWDIERDGVWVEQGCSAEFASARVSASPQMRRVVRCDSNGGKVACPVILRGAPVRLLRQRSMWPCKEGRTWGTRRNEIWVSRGCDGEFEVGAEDGSGFVAVPRMVTCESKKSSRRTCGVSVERQVRVGRQISKKQCVEGQTWGWSRDGVWVNDGCRAEFIVD